MTETSNLALHHCLREVMRLLGDIGCSHVTIARAAEHSSQFRFTPDKETTRGYVMEGRRWCDGTEATPYRGTERAYVGWSRWSGCAGFTPESVLATDWRIL